MINKLEGVPLLSPGVVNPEGSPGAKISSADLLDDTFFPSMSPPCHYETHSGARTPGGLHTAAL